MTRDAATDESRARCATDHARGERGPDSVPDRAHHPQQAPTGPCHMRGPFGVSGTTTPNPEALTMPLYLTLTLAGLALLCPAVVTLIRHGAEWATVTEE